MEVPMKAGSAGRYHLAEAREVLMQLGLVVCHPEGMEEGSNSVYL